MSSMRVRSGPQHEFAVAIGAFDEALVAHFEIDLGMAQRAATAVAGDAGIVHFDGLRRFDGHGDFLGCRRNIATKRRAATIRKSRLCQAISRAIALSTWSF